jgi:hypothetical protein
MAPRARFRPSASAGGTIRGAPAADEEQASPITLDVLLLPRERDRCASFR